MCINCRDASCRASAPHDGPWAVLVAAFAQNAGGCAFGRAPVLYASTARWAVPLG